MYTTEYKIATGEYKLTEKNKQIESAGIFVLLLTILGMIVYYTWVENEISTQMAIPLIIVIVPFAMGLYLNATKPQKAQMLAALWGIFVSVVTRKITIAEAMKQCEIVMVNAVTLWNSLNQKAEDDKKQLEINALKAQIEAVNKQLEKVD